MYDKSQSIAMKMVRACLLLLLLTGCTTTVTLTPYIDEHKSKEQVLALFMKSADTSLAIPDRGRIRYYMGPSAQITAGDRTEWKRLTDLIEKETPMRFTRVADEESANFSIVMIPVAQGEKRSCSEITTTSVRTFPYVQEKVKVELRRTDDFLLRPCVVRSILVAIGFRSIDRADTYSVLNTRTALSQPTSTDLYLINLMLNSGLLPGMSDPEIEAAIDRQYDRIQLSERNRKVLETLDPEQLRVLENAVQPKPRPIPKSPPLQPKPAFQPKPPAPAEKKL